MHTNINSFARPATLAADEFNSSHALTQMEPHTLSHSHSLTRSLTLSLTHSLSLSLSHTHTHTHTQTDRHTQTHTHRHTHTHTQQQQQHLHPKCYNHRHSNHFIYGYHTVGSFTMVYSLCPCQNHMMCNKVSIKSPLQSAR